LRDKTKLTAAEILLYEISGSQGGGVTNNESYELKQFPFPESQKATINMRKVDPKIGDPEDHI
jgi:hypothetical protein